MADVGVLKWGEHDELLDGQVIDPFPITPFHAAVTRRLAKAFSELPEENCIISVRNPVRLDEFNELHPDVMLLKYVPDYYKSQHPGTEDVLLLVEVAEASLNYDREAKLPVYGQTGVDEVWIINLNELTVEVYREPHFTGYGSKTVLRPGDKVAPLAFADAGVDVSEILKR